MERQSEFERRMIGESPDLQVQDEENGKTVIRGYAALFQSRSQNLGGFVEVIAPGAFDDVMKSNPDVFGRYNHDRLLARTSSGTMKLELDERGLRYTIYPKHADADVVESISRGDVRGSSFAFQVRGEDEHWYKDKDGTMIRELRNISVLADAGPVDNPAYPATEAFVSKRALEIAASEGVAESRSDEEEASIDVTPTDVEEPAEHPVLSEPPDDSDDGESRSAVEVASEEQEDEGREVGMRPTEGMASAARRGLELHEKGLSGDGLKPETVARANRLARREEMNRDWIVEMNAWFKRHYPSSTSEGWDEPPEYSPFFTAFLLWGGRAGMNWSSRKVAEIEREEQTKRAYDISVSMRAAVAISKLRTHLHS